MISIASTNPQLHNVFDAKTRPEWLSRTLNSIGVEKLVDDALCYTLAWSCPEPPKFFESTVGIIYFWMLVFANIFVLVLLVSVVGALIKHLRDPSLKVLSEHRDEIAAVSLTVLVPCYLPNEQPIILETIRHIIEKIEYDYPFTLIVCYNTPKPMEFEKTLAKLDGTVFPNGRSLRVLHVDGSISKAENLNAALDIVDTENLVIYDADHHPEPDSLLIASAAMRTHGASCIQGSTFLRSRPTLLAAYINAEFFVTHFVFFPAMQFATSMGVFGGSNALWKTEALRGYQFRRDMQTEDIDLSARALIGGKVHIRFEPRCRSGELPPSSFVALYHQRLRWALGWDQVTLQHMSSIWSAKRIGCCRKLGLTYILPLRWGILFSATLNAILTPVIGFWYYETTGGSLGLPIDACIMLSMTCFFTVCTVVAINMVLYEPVRRWPAVILFQATGSLYIGWQILLVLVSLFKIYLKSDGEWVVTTREQPVQQQPSPSAPSRWPSQKSADVSARVSPPLSDTSEGDTSDTSESSERSPPQTPEPPDTTVAEPDTALRRAGDRETRHLLVVEPVRLPSPIIQAAFGNLYQPARVDLQLDSPVVLRRPTTRYSELDMV